MINSIKSFDKDKYKNIDRYTQYKREIVNAYKKQLQLEKIPTEQISEILTATKAIQISIKGLMAPANMTLMTTHPFPANACPICTYTIGASSLKVIGRLHF